MKDSVSFKVTCPHCGQKISVERSTDVDDYLDDWDRMLSDFDMEEFHCSCGEHFLGAETVQSEKVAKIVEMVKTLKAEGKFDISKDSVRIDLGLSDIWKIIRELKDLKGDLI